MAILSKKDFSQFAGVSKAAISKACKVGSLVVRPDKKIDTDNPVNQDYVRLQNSKKNDGSNKKNDNTSCDGPNNNNNIYNNSDQGLDDQILDENGKLSLDKIINLNKTEIDKFKVIEEIKKTQIKTEEMRQLLIKRDLVQRVFNKLYMIDVNQFKTMGPSISAEIAGLCNIDDDQIILKVSEIVENECNSVLSHIKRILDDFLKGIGAEKIE